MYSGAEVPVLLPGKVSVVEVFLAGIHTLSLVSIEYCHESVSFKYPGTKLKAVVGVLDIRLLFDPVAVLS